MTPEQLERFGDYIKHIPPSRPFTWEEIQELAKIKATRDGCPGDGKFN
ncbi:MAG TPA: hypothetical protein VM101_08235 [Flavitalea sp.]|nr:hypothetical protein [Flavitalea sp.]